MHSSIGTTLLRAMTRLRIGQLTVEHTRTNLHTYCVSCPAIRVSTPALEIRACRTLVTHASFFNGPEHEANRAHRDLLRRNAWPADSSMVPPHWMAPAPQARQEQSAAAARPKTDGRHSKAAQGLARARAVAGLEVAPAALQQQERWPAAAQVKVRAPRRQAPEPVRLPPCPS